MFFRHKPLGVEAFQFDGTAATAEMIYTWLGGSRSTLYASGNLDIRHNNGDVVPVDLGDWVVRRRLASGDCVRVIPNDQMQEEFEPMTGPGF